MKIWCDCNSNWELYFNINQISTQVTGGSTRIGISLGMCDVCGLFRWYDADYENMMFDLKNMNQM